MFMCIAFIMSPLVVKAATVYVDGNFLSSDVEPQVINDRVLVPFSAIGSAIGARTSWDDSQKKVTMTLNGKYVVIYVGKNIMTYGTMTSNGTSYVYETANERTLDSVPINVEGRVLVPLRAVSEGIGANVVWVQTTKTVYITSPIKPEAPPKPSIPQTPPQSTTSSSQTETVIADTTYFKIISGARAQSMYNNKESFILVYYDSTMSTSMEYVPTIIDIAQDLRVRVYGVDLEYETGTEISPKFIGTYVGTSNVLPYPYVFYVVSQDDIKVNKEPTIEQQLRIEFDRYMYSTRYYGSSSTDYSRYLIPISKSGVDSKLTNGDKFILVYYDSQDTDSSYTMNNVINRASYDSGYNVYTIDAASSYYVSSTSNETRTLRNDSLWWGNIYGNNRFPTVFFIEKGSPMTTGYSPTYRPTNVADLTSQIKSFMEKSTTD